MASFRVQFFFSEFRQGWTETWYIDQGSMTGVLGKIQTLAPLLVAPRTVHCSLDAARAIQVNPPIPRRGALVGINLKGTRADGVLLGSEAEDVVQTCAFMTANFLDGTKRPVLLRGLADLDVARDPASGQGVPIPALNGLLNTLAAGLSLDNWEIRHYSSAIVSTPVTQVDGDPVNTQWTRITGPALANFPVQSQVHFTAVPLPTLPWLKGQWLVQGGTPTSISIPYVYPLGVPFKPLKMLLWPTTYSYVPFLTWTFRDFRSRKTGRPTSLTRGRSAGVSFRR